VTLHPIDETPSSRVMRYDFEKLNLFTRRYEMVYISITILHARKDTTHEK